MGALFRQSRPSCHAVFCSIAYIALPWAFGVHLLIAQMGFIQPCLCVCLSPILMRIGLTLLCLLARAFLEGFWVCLLFWFGKCETAAGA